MYSIIIPVYQGEQTVSPLFKQIKAFFEEKKLPFEIVFIYDCGSDQSWSIIQELFNIHPEIIQAIHLSRNFGQHNAIICGFKHAKGDIFITMDEDLQHNPADIEKLVEAQKIHDFDLVYGKYEILKHNAFRNITSQIARKMLLKGIPGLHPHYSSFRLIKREIAKQTLNMSNAYTFLDGYISWITTHVSSTTVGHAGRAGGKSSYNTRKLIEHTINILITFSNLPIRFFSYTAFGIFIISSIYSLYILGRKLIFNDLISGFATIAIFLGMGFGLVLLGLGIIGEYIYRINQKTTSRPNFHEREVLSKDR